MIATQQPIAGDLRLIASVIHISTDLERIGDYAAGIAKIVLMHGDQPLLKPLIDIPRMAELGRAMLRRSLDALVRRDAEAAETIVAEDDEVDALYDQIYRELLTYMIERPEADPPGDLAALGGAQPGADRRPRDEHLRAGGLHGDGPDRGA